MSNAKQLSKLGNGPAFSAYNSAQQNLTSGVYTKVTLDVEDYDTNSCFASSRFTPNVAGYYQINAQVYGTGSSTAVQTVLSVLYKNGAQLQGGSFGALNSSTNGISNLSIVVYLNGTTDYVELYGYIFGTSPNVPASSGAFSTRMSGYLVRGA